jgi:hypothetical protein
MLVTDFASANLPLVLLLENVEVVCLCSDAVLSLFWVGLFDLFTIKPDL